MLQDKSTLDYNNVFGLTYEAAEAEMQQIEYLLSSRVGKGFISREQCMEFAKANHLDLVVYMKSNKSYYFVTHRGYALRSNDWKMQYNNLLYWVEENEKGKEEKITFAPTSYKYLNSARLYGEQGEGKFKPLFKRNYFVPTGYYDEATGTFNTARSPDTFARHTGADTSHIHALLQAIAGECYPYLLSWLRAKLVNPTAKTHVIPIFVGAQGTGKSTFGEVICTALFGAENVLVTDQFDASARFNTDSADALIISIEEKSQDDKRNTSSTLKSRATNTKVRKESKGVDPIYQESYTDFILSTNDFVPLKFEDRGEQRRFMVMDCDPTFTRNQSTLADEVFTKLYGFNDNREQICKGLIEDKVTIEQFKKELWDRKYAEGINYKHFPKTDAYHRCFTIPRTSEAVGVEIIAKALVPFIKASLIKGIIQNKVTVFEDDEEKEIFLDHIVTEEGALQFVYRKSPHPDRVAICRQLVFIDNRFNQPYAHSVVERTLIDLSAYFKEQGLMLLGDTNCPAMGFKNIVGRAKYSPAAWFVLYTEPVKPVARVVEPVIEPSFINTPKHIPPSKIERIGERVRFNKNFVYDEEGEFETLNELKPGCKERTKENAQYLDTFLLEADTTTSTILYTELKRLAQGSSLREKAIDAEKFYKERLHIQDIEADRLFNAGIVCRVVYSGSKSLHMLVRVADSPDNLEEREWLDSYLKATLSDKLIFDRSTKDPTRLTRYPYKKGLERITRVPAYDEVVKEYIINPDTVTKGKQRVLNENWNNVYKLNWRLIYEAWLRQFPAYYEERGRMLPSKQIYKSAAIALLEGTFFTDRAWSGIRQETFFPAYRLLRTMGYKHDELWTDFLSYMDKYHKKSEIGYWRSRENCSLTLQIDAEVDGDKE